MCCLSRVRVFPMCLTSYAAHSTCLEYPIRQRDLSAFLHKARGSALDGTDEGDYPVT